MKKKGFTLIELVCALAMLAIVLSTVFVAFSNSTIVWKKSDVDLELASQNQSIVQCIRAQGKVWLDRVYVDSSFVKPNGNSNGNLNVFLNFNDYSDIYNATNASDNSKFVPGSLNPDYNDYIKTNPTTKYGALIEITKKPLNASSYASYIYYSVRVTVWNVKKGADYQCQTTFYVGD